MSRTTIKRVRRDRYGKHPCVPLDSRASFSAPLTQYREPLPQLTQRRKERRLFMKRFSGLLGLFLLMGFVAPAEGAINLEVAEVQNGFAFIKGNNAVRGAQIFWEGSLVTTADNNNGGFSFNGAVPADCVGVLSDGGSPISVQLLDCTPVSAAAPVPLPRTGQTNSFDANFPQRDDGALRKGVALPSPRFTDNQNGTITDNLTGLIWLKNANCPGISRTWQTALDDVVQLNTN